MSIVNSIEIRDAGTGDRDVIVAYNQALAWETESLKLDPGRLARGVDAVLDGARSGRYFVACDGEHTLAQLMITTEWSDWRNAEFWWVQSVYVRPENRGQGLFSALFRHIERMAREDPDVCGVRLYVEKDNERAARLYRKLGLEDEHYHMMEIDFTRREAD